MLSNSFRKCMDLYPPDFDGAKKLLHQGLDINLITDPDGETLLSEIIMDCEAFDPCVYCISKDCESCLVDRDDEQVSRHYLLEIIRFFLDNGYDVTMNNGRHGAEALSALCWSTYDKAILEAAELLLDAGADPLCLDVDGNNVLYSIDWKLSGCLHERDAEQVELFTALYDLVKARTM